MTDSWMILFLLASVGCAYCAWRWRDAAQRLAAGEAKAAEARVRLEQVAAVTAERDTLRAKAESLAGALIAEQAAATARSAAAAEREEALRAMKGEVEKTFETLANRALGQSQQSFLHLANETFEKHKAAAAGGVKDVVGPVQEQFAKLAETIAALDKSRTEDKSALGEQMRQLNAAMSQTQNVTGALANALRGGPKTRGRWGEETLKNVLEMSGLSARIDYLAEQSHEGEDGLKRPDVQIRLPGGRCVVVDSKVALSGYFDAAEATDEGAREMHLRKHAQELRGHLKKLASKEYWRAVPDTADFVVMFVPGDNFLAAAFEHDPMLFQDGFKDRVVIIGPSNLFALAKTIAFGWRQEEIQKNADEIAKLGRELYARLEPFSQHLVRVGNALGASVNHFNQAIGSFETKVLVTARKFKDLGSAEGNDPVQPAQIELAPRLPTPQSELDLGAPSAAKAKR